MTNEEAAKLAEVDARSKSNTHRIDELSEQYKAINRIATAVEVIATEQKHQTDDMRAMKSDMSSDIGEIKSDVGKLNEKVEAIEERPAKKAEAVLDKIGLSIIGVIAGALIGALLTHLGLN